MTDRELLRWYAGRATDEECSKLVEELGIREMAKQHCRCDDHRPELVKNLWSRGGNYSRESLGIFRCPVCGKYWLIRHQFDDGTGSDDIWVPLGGMVRGYEFTQKMLDDALAKEETWEETFGRVKRIIVDQLGVSQRQVTPEARLSADLGADSLDSVVLMAAFEEEFAIDIPNEDVENLDTVEKIVTYIRSNLSEVRGRSA